jgi:uncharacterized membrane-anchored protein
MAVLLPKDDYLFMCHGVYQIPAELVIRPVRFRVCSKFESVVVRAAFILTRPWGATLGDILTIPHPAD